MSQYVNHEAIKAARRARLYDFLLSRHPGDVEREGDSLRLCCDHSVSVRRGYSGYKDFATGETGNAIECLTRYLDYEFPDAVTALCQFCGIPLQGQERAVPAPGTARTPQVDKTPVDVPKRAQEPPQAAQRAFAPPEPLQGPYRQLYAYLTQQRGIPATLIQRLIDWGLLDQEKDHANMVFIDPARSFAELRGSNSFKPFHQVMFSDPAAFWWFKSGDLDSNATVAYVCESAIDAISLYLLQGDSKDNGLYCSIGGVANQQRIDRIKAGMGAAGCKTVIAVDNDQAGEDCRQRNPDCPAIIPKRKDWNEDWTARAKK